MEPSLKLRNILLEYKSMVKDDLIGEDDYLIFKKRAVENHLKIATSSNLDSPTKENIQSIARDMREFKINFASKEISRGPSTDAEWYLNHGKNSTKVWFEPYKPKKKIFAGDNIFESDAKENKDVQPRWSDVIINLINKLQLKITLVDKNKSPSIGTRKPDISGYLKGKPNNAFYMAIVGELKGGNKKDVFKNKDKGQLASFLFKLIDETKRKFACGFLCDGRLVQFFRMTGNSTLEETLVYGLDGEGEDLLLGFLNTDPRLHGLEVDEIKIDNDEVVIQSHLGYGAHSIVWKGTYKDNEVAVKKFIKSEILLQKEIEILKKLSGVSNVTQLIGRSTSDNMSIIVSPVGTPFLGSTRSQSDSVMRRCHFACLVKTIQEIHSNCNVVHRDIKPSNFFQIGNKTLLNDWSSAIDVNQSENFNGTRVYAPEEFLLKGERNTVFPPKYRHDLESLVKSLYVTIHSSIFYSQFMLDEDYKNKQKILNFWKVIFNIPCWSRLLNAARECDYNKLIEESKEILPELEISQ